MLSFRAKKTPPGCGFSRREWLRVGGLSAFGICQSSLSATETSSVSAQGSFSKAKRCIVLFMLGGPPQHETWDPKPDGPTEIRGEFGTTATATPGLHVCELMPKTAKLTDRIAVLRAMATDDNAHSASGYWMLTGRPHSPKNKENALPGPPNDWPSMAAVVRHLKGDQSSLPGSVRLPEEIRFGYPKRYGTPVILFGRDKMPDGLGRIPIPGLFNVIRTNLTFEYLTYLCLLTFQSRDCNLVVNSKI